MSISMDMNQRVSMLLMVKYTFLSCIAPVTPPLLLSLLPLPSHFINPYPLAIQLETQPPSQISHSLALQLTGRLSPPVRLSPSVHLSSQFFCCRKIQRLKKKKKKKKLYLGPFPFFRRSVIPEGFRAGHESTARVYYTSLPPMNLSAALIRLIYPKAVNVRSSLTPCIIPPFSFIYHSSQWGFSLKLRRHLPDYLVKFTG